MLEKIMQVYWVVTNGKNVLGIDKTKVSTSDPKYRDRDFGLCFSSEEEANRYKQSYPNLANWYAVETPLWRIEEIFVGCDHFILDAD